MRLRERNERFESLAAQVPHTARQGLVLEHKLNAERFQTLQWHVRAYISACYSPSGPVLSEAQILERLGDEGNPLLNRTPNGVLMPKYEFSMEYNSLHRSLVRSLEEIGFDSLADSWQLPIIVRAVRSGAFESSDIFPMQRCFSKRSKGWGNRRSPLICGFG